MARTQYQHRLRALSGFTARKIQRLPYRESELEVPQPDRTIPLPTSPAPTSIQLRQAGVWTRLLTAPSASATTVSTADTLASELARISSSTAPLRTSWVSGVDGIRVGLASEWAAAGVSLPTGTWGSWDWALVTISDQPYVLGRTDRGFQVAIRRLLYALGHRQLTTQWEILPTLAADVAMVSDQRMALPLRFVIGLGDSFGNGTRVTAWMTANGVINDGKYGYGHVWNAVETSYSTDFTAHPEWLAGGGLGHKFCVYEPGLIEVFKSYVRGVIANNPDQKAVSTSASDGSQGWDLVCTGTHEEQTKTPSDRQVYLANQIQAMLDVEYPGIVASFQAYGDTSPDPTITLDPKILVVWAEAYIQNGRSPEAVLAGYIAKGCQTHAPYHYASVWPWDFDLPGQARATKRAELAIEESRILSQSIPAIGSLGESSCSWAPYGRWYWSILGVMFADSATARWDAFPGLAFPSAPTQSNAWYALLDRPGPMSTDMVHRLCQAADDLIAALPLGSPERERALDCGRWAHYVALYRAYTAAKSAATLEPLMKWSWRIRGRDLIAWLAPYFEPQWAADRKAVAALYGLSDLNQLVGSTIWGDAPTTDSEIRAELAADIAANALIPFTLVGYTSDMVPVTGLTHTSTVRGTFVYERNSATGEQAWWYQAKTTADQFTVKGGIAFNRTDHIKIYDHVTQEVIVDQDIPYDQIARTVTVNGVVGRIYRIEMTTPGGTQWSWTAGMHVAVATTPDLGLFSAAYSGYFYVPRGTVTVGFYASGGTVRFFSADNVQVGANIVADHAYYQVSVPAGKDGQVWRFSGVNGPFGLLTVPPIWAQRPEELFLPREVCTADGLTIG